MRRRGRSFGGDSLDQPQMTSGAPALIRQTAFGHPITPGQREVRGDVVQPPPDSQQSLAESIGRVFAVGTSSQITLQRLVHLGGDELETLPPLDVGVHWMILSGTGLIL